jgi:hypothetical protein
MDSFISTPVEYKEMFCENGDFSNQKSLSAATSNTSSVLIFKVQQWPPQVLSSSNPPFIQFLFFVLFKAMLEYGGKNELTCLLERLLFLMVAQWTMLMCCIPSVRREE